MPIRSKREVELRDLVHKGRKSTSDLPEPSTQDVRVQVHTHRTHTSNIYLSFVIYVPPTCYSKVHYTSLVRKRKGRLSWTF